MTMHSSQPRLPSLARLLLILALVAVGLLAQPGSVSAATFTVTKTTDSKDGGCNSDCSLREAIIASHQQPGVDTITLLAGKYRVTLSDLDITSSLNIVGAGGATTIIESNGQDRVLEVRPGSTVTIDKVTIRNGNLFTRGGHGGGILNDGALTLTNSTVSGNQVQYYEGGGIYNTGMLSLIKSAVIDNYSQESNGGGIYNDAGMVTISESIVNDNRVFASGGGGIVNDGGTMTISTSTVHSNAADGGGGISNYNGGTLALINSTISDNRAYHTGGGIYNTGTLTLTNSTVSGNETDHSLTEGAGISNYDTGTLILRNSTITGNVLAYLGVGAGVFTSSTASTTLSNTIIAGNTAYDGIRDCAGTLTSQGYNLIENMTGCTITGDLTGNRTGVNAQLGPLQNNGGSTLTHLPASGSPAIDAGDPATPGSSGSACPATDQRGQTRPTDGNGDSTARCDIGAVER